MNAATLPRGDCSKTTVEQGSLYADPEHQRVVRLSDPENYENYRVEVWTWDNGEVNHSTEMWASEDVRSFAAGDATEYIAGHCFDGYSPYGVWATNTGGHNCPECGKFMTGGFYHNGGKFVPGLTCPDHDAVGTHCPGHMTCDETINRGLYIPVPDYLERRFGSA